MTAMRAAMSIHKLVAVLILGLSWTVTSCSSESRDGQCHVAFIGDQVFQNRNIREETISVADVKLVLLTVLGIPLREDVGPRESSVLRKLIRSSIGKLSDEVRFLVLGGKSKSGLLIRSLCPESTDKSHSSSRRNFECMETRPICSDVLGIYK